MAQGIQIGDAVLKMFVDWTEINNVASDLPSKLKPGTDAAATLGTQFDKVGTSASAAGAQATATGAKMAAAGKSGAAGTQVADESVQALNARIKQLEAELGVLQERFQNTGRRSATAMHEARGSVALLGEEVGIRVPRHLQGFLAGLPGVTAALSAAFAPIAILAFIDILEKVPGKIAEIEDYLAGFDEEKKKAFSADTTGFISQLNTAISLIKEETIQQHTLGKAGIDATRGQIAGLSDYQKKLGEVQDDLNRFKTAIDEVTDKSRRQQLAQVPFQQSPFFTPAVIEKSAAETRSELEFRFKQLSEFGQQLSEKYKISFPKIEPPPAGASEASIKKSLESLNTAVEEEIKKASNEQAQLTSEGIKDQDALRRESLQEQVGVLKSGLDRQLAAIEQFKQGVRTVYLSGKADATDWALAQVKATDEANRAHEEYLQKLEETYRKAGDSSKANAAAQELTVFQAQAAAKSAGLLNDSIQKETDSISKLKVELADARVSGFAKNLEQAATASKVLADAQQDLLLAEQSLSVAREHGNAKEIADAESHLTTVTITGDEAIKKATKSYEAAAAQAQALATANAHLSESVLKVIEVERQIDDLRIAASFRDQEAEIERLAKFEIITEEQKEIRLKALYEREERDALAALDDELAQRRRKLDEAQAAVKESKDNPIFSEAQKKEAESNLNEALAAYERVQLQKAKTEDEYRAKINGLAVSERQLIATELALAKAKEAGLIQARAAAIAEGNDTKAVDKQIDATRKYENELQRLLTRSNSVLRTRPTWDSFFSDLINRSLSAGKAFQQMGDLFASAMAQSVEAAVNGSASAGEALAQLVKSTLASLAGAAVGHVFTEIAKAASDFATAATLAADPFTAALAPGFIASAHAHLVAAAEWGAIGAGAAVAGSAIPSGGGSSNSPSSSNDVSPSKIGENGQATPQPVTVHNTQHFGSGALVNRRMLAVVGDNPSGGDGSEGIIPLHDQRAKQGIADALVGNLVAAFSGVSPKAALAPELIADIVNPQPFTRATLQVAREASQLDRESGAHRLASAAPQVVTHHESHEHNHYWHIEGVISADNLSKVMKKMSDQVSSGKARLKSSTTYRVTKRG